MLLETLQNFLSGFKVVRVAGGPVQEVGRLDELGTQQVLAPVNLKVFQMERKTLKKVNQKKDLKL